MSAALVGRFVGKHWSCGSCQIQCSGMAALDQDIQDHSGDLRVLDMNVRLDPQVPKRLRR